MSGQTGFWDIDERYERLSKAGDPLEKLNALVPWEVFRKPLVKALKRSDGARGGRPAFDPVVMFKILVLHPIPVARRPKCACLTVKLAGNDIPLTACDRITAPDRSITTSGIKSASRMRSTTARNAG